LLGDGGGTLAFALGIGQGGADDADRVDGVVLVKARVLARDDGFAEVFGDLVEGHDRALFAMDAADFLAEVIENDRALGHGMDDGQIVALGLDAIDGGQNDQEV